MRRPYGRLAAAASSRMDEAEIYATPRPLIQEARRRVAGPPNPAVGSAVRESAPGGRTAPPASRSLDFIGPMADLIGPIARELPQFAANVFWPVLSKKRPIFGDFVPLQHDASTACHAERRGFEFLRPPSKYRGAFGIRPSVEIASTRAAGRRARETSTKRAAGRHLSGFPISLDRQIKPDCRGPGRG